MDIRRESGPADRVYPDIRDEAGPGRETRRAHRLKFTGQALFHWAQIEMVHGVFSPTEEEIEYARRLSAAFEATPGEGAVALDGRLLDLPAVERDRWILQGSRDENRRKGASPC